ncbi:MAG: hypothetical protein N2450_05590 [bacterium]|nr:hypothetical protein [bacterium]
MKRTLVYFVVVVIPISSFLSGCLSKSAITQNIARTFAVQGDWEKAAAVFLKDTKPTQAVDVLFNRGLAHFEMGNTIETENELRKANEIIEDLFTKSVSRTAAALITNDRTLPYEGTNFEKGILHYYRGLNFYRQGNLEAFTIEARALTNYLVQLPGLTKRKYNDDAFLRYIGGLGYDVANQPNDAWIAYKHSIQLYPQTIGETPDFIKRAERIAAYKTGVLTKDSLKQIGIHYPLSGTGRVVVFIEAGVVAGLETEHITFPILEEDERVNIYATNFNLDSYGLMLMDRYYDPYYSTRYRVKDWIHIAVPKIVDDGTTVTKRVKIQSGNFAVDAELAHNTSKVFKEEFQERLPSILARTVIRAILKRVAYNNAQKEGGAVAGVLTRVVGEALETADTRSWTLLPDKYFVFDGYIPTGKYNLTITAYTDGGKIVDVVTLNDVVISDQKVNMVRLRIK